MKVGKTSRGFGLGEFKDAKGNECSIQDSSLATQGAIWFGVQDVNPQRMGENGLEPVPPPELPIPIAGMPGFLHDILFNTRMHLSESGTKSLIRTFEKFLSEGKVRARKFKDLYGHACSLRTTDGCIEVGHDDPNPQICEPGKGWRPVVYPEDTIWTMHMFLGKKEITMLLPHMKRFAEGGYISG